MQLDIDRCRSVRLISYERNNHAVKVDEEHQKVETEFDKGFLTEFSEPFEQRGKDCRLTAK